MEWMILNECPQEYFNAKLKRSVSLSSLFKVFVVFHL